MPESFKRPNFDDSVLIPQWIQYNGQHSPDHPLFVYSLDAKVEAITWSRAAQAIENAARLVCAHLKPRIQRGNSLPVVGILANIDAITYHTLVWGIVRAKAVAFLISTRNSPIALSQLLRKTETQLLFVSADKPMRELASSAMAYPESRDLTVHVIPSFDDLYSESSRDSYPEPIPEPCLGQDAIDTVAVILHSSGTTSFPKPVPLTHRNVLQWSRIASLNIAGKGPFENRLAVHGLPVFHAMGYFGTPWAACTGMTIAVFPPQTPPIVPSFQNVLEAAISCRSTVLLTIPIFVEIWSRDTESLELLKRLRAIIFSGGPLNKAVGVDLSGGGVSLLGFYGATELGPVTEMVLGKTCNNEWDWFSMSPECDPRYLPQEDQPGVFELVFVKCPTHFPASVNCEIEGKRAFATNDLVIRHPTNPMKFRVFGRKDDQIMLSTGEKTNPGPIEIILCRNPQIRLAVMFGRGRSQNGVLLQPAKGHEIDPNDENSLAQYRNGIWSSVEQANAFAPTHSRLFKEMVLVTHPSKPMELTAKLAPRRAMVLGVYKDEIEAAYAAADASAQLGVTPPLEWTPSQILEFVRNTVHTVMRKTIINDADDIFQRGGDSLQATYIRNSILQAVRTKNKLSAGRISQNFVYANPSIANIASQLVAFIETDPKDSSDEDASQIEKLTRLVSDFSDRFPVHKPSAHQEASLGEVVLITGTTGGLGTQLLSHIASSPDVIHVYALNRASGNSHTSLHQKQAEALMQRGLHAGIINLPKVTLVECDTASDNLGIDLKLFDEIRNNVTLIIHNAWRVNFNLTLDSFGPMIRGVRSLIDLALQSPKANPPRFIFTGSVSVYRNWKGLRRPLEAPITDPRVALGSGYSESKWVGERILEEAAKNTPLRPVIVRIGQMTSNSSGAWNSGDWLPAIVRSGQVLGVLPSRDDSIAWISLDASARAIFDFRTSHRQHLHLSHPNPVPWGTVFGVFSSMLGVPLVPWDEWLEKLENDKTGPKANPAVHLLDFFRNVPSEDTEHREAIGVPLLDLKEAFKASPSLADPSLPQVCPQDAEAWIKYWRGTGFLSA